MDITFKHLKYLMALAEEGHFGRAAAAVNVSQPALSIQIRSLEEILGTQLVERRAREIVLTPAGREVLRRAGRIMDEIRGLGEAARREQGLAGRLCLGVIPTVAPYLLPRALPMMRVRNLALDLRIREATTQTLVEDLRRGLLDAAVIALPSGAPDLAETPLFTDRFLLAGSTGRIAAARAARLHPDALSASELLLLEDGHCLTEQALAACALVPRDTQMDLRAASLSTLCRLAAEGLGVTFVPELAVRAETAGAPGIALMRFGAPEPERTIGLVRRRSSVDHGWFGELSDLLASAGRAEAAHAAEAVAA